MVKNYRNLTIFDRFIDVWSFLSVPMTSSCICGDVRCRRRKFSFRLRFTFVGRLFINISYRVWVHRYLIILFIPEYFLGTKFSSFQKYFMPDTVPVHFISLLKFRTIFFVRCYMFEFLIPYSYFFSRTFQKTSKTRYLFSRHFAQIVC